MPQLPAPYTGYFRQDLMGRPQPCSVHPYVALGVVEPLGWGPPQRSRRRRRPEPLTQWLGAVGPQEVTIEEEGSVSCAGVTGEENRPVSLTGAVVSTPDTEPQLP